MGFFMFFSKIFYATTTSVMNYKAKKREKRKETLQIRRHAPVHVSEWTHAKDATED
jgi:hypothetical protein